MNRLFLIIVGVLSVVVVVELGVYFYMQNTLKNSPQTTITATTTAATSSLKSPYSFSEEQSTTFEYLLNFVSLSRSKLFAAGTASIRLVGVAIEVQQVRNRMVFKLCIGARGNLICEPLDFDATKIHYINTKQVSENDKIQIDIEYQYLEKLLNITITKLQ